ncbi:jg4735, partial [Pararge aegeria aegeria]
MFSIGKCSVSGSEESSPGGAKVASDEVASAVAAVSDEIGDILKDELGDADRADRIGAELADLSAELGLLAGLADEPSQDFPSLFEIAIGHRASGSGSSSSSWSGGRGGRSRRPPRPQRAPRRRPIAKGKEMSRRRSAVARRAASLRVRRVEVASDASDVGADSDSDDQWTELDDNSGSTDSSSAKDVSGLEIDCPPYQHKGS